MSKESDGATSVPRLLLDEAMQARVLIIAGCVTSLVALLLAIVDVIQRIVSTPPAPPASDLVVDLVLIVIGGLVAWLARRGKRRAASWVAIVGLLGIASFQLCSEGRPPQDLGGAFLLLLSSVLASLLLGGRAAWGTLAVGGAIYVGAQILWLRGAFPGPPVRTAARQASFATLAWIACSAIVVSIVRSALSSLQRQGGELEQRVAERTTDLERARGSLEELVRERTVALQAANDRLLAEASERERIASALRESDRMQRAVVDALPDLTGRLDADGNYISGPRARGRASSPRRAPTGGMSAIRCRPSWLSAASEPGYRRWRPGSW